MAPEQFLFKKNCDDEQIIRVEIYSNLFFWVSGWYLAD
jgi:hypothetical protein